MTIVYKSSIDLFLYVVGSSYENEVNSGGWGDKEGKVDNMEGTVDLGLESKPSESRVSTLLLGSLCSSFSNPFSYFIFP